MSATPAAFDTTPLPTLHYAPATSEPTLDDDPWQPLQRKPVRGSVALPLLDLGDPSEQAGVDGARGQNAIGSLATGHVNLSGIDNARRPVITA